MNNETLRLKRNLDILLLEAINNSKDRDAIITIVERLKFLGKQTIVDLDVEESLE